MALPCVLIADNDRAVSSLLCEVLTRAGCDVRIAGDGHQAMEMLVKTDVRVFVCDLDMPRASGIEVLEWLQRQPYRPAAVVITGYLDFTNEQHLRGLPCVRQILRKPFDLTLFSQLVRRLVESASDLGRGLEGMN